MYDELYVSKGNKNSGIEINSNVKSLENEKNIICKAYNLLKESFDEITSVDVILNKNIPMQAGLGGGSTDCTAFIMCMKELFNLDLSIKQMQDLGVKLGADVPASFCDKPIIAKGIGEVIEELSSSFRYHIIIIKPKFSCDTKEMYRKLDCETRAKQNYNSNDMKRAIENKDIDKLSKNLYNVFENCIQGIDTIKNELVAAGALNSLMTGSGSCVYGIFKDKKRAKIAYRNLAKNYETYFCITM